MIRVFLCGEGPTELGGLAAERPYRTEEEGVLHELLAAVVESDFEVVDACRWKEGPNYVVGSARTRQRGDAHNLKAAALQASEANADLLVFARDEDGVTQRATDVETGRTEAKALFPGLRIAGGLAVQCTEAWLLAILGQRQTERKNRRAVKLELERATAATSLDKAALVRERGLDEVPDDARSLRAWADDVRGRSSEAGDGEHARG